MSGVYDEHVLQGFSDQRENVSNRYISDQFDRNSNMDSTLVQMLGQNPTVRTTHQYTSGGEAICDGCRKPIQGTYRTAQGKKFHPTCFNLDVTCDRCNKPVFGEVIDALNKHWHKACWTCVICYVPLGDSFLEKKGDPYCQKCGNTSAVRIKPAELNSRENQRLEAERKDQEKQIYNNIQQGKERCAVCNQIISTEALVMGGKIIHESCFKCCLCNQPIDQLEGYSQKSEGPVCASCSSKGGESCIKCRKPIVGKFLKSSVGKFHPQCFTCTSCGGSLATGFAEKQGKPYCGKCINSAPTVTQTNTTTTQKQGGFVIDPITGKKRYV